MPEYSYEAMDRSGLGVEGALGARSLGEAAAILRDRGLLVYRLRESTAVREGIAAEDASSGRLPAFAPLRHRDRVLFYRQMALMLRSGLTLLQALDTVARSSGKRAVRDAAGALSGHIRKGEPFSSALQLEGRLADRLSIELVRSAEASGEMSAVLEQAAMLIERHLRVRADLLKSFFYPAIVALVSIGVSAFLVVQVIPRFASFFARRNMELPPLTRKLVDLSSWIREHGLLLLLGLFLVLAMVVVLRMSKQGRLRSDRAILRLPVVGPLLLLASLNRLLTTLGALLASGLTLLQALGATRGVMGNRAFESALDVSRERILGGEGFAESLRGSPLPPVALQVLTVGENTGSLTEVLEELRSSFDREMESRIKWLSAMIEPLLILVVGVIVGVVYAAFFQAVFQLVGR